MTRLDRSTRSNRPMAALAICYGIIAYLGFLGCYVYLIFFLADVGVPRAISNGARAALPTAILVNTALVALFGVQHAIMARAGFKAIWTKIVPASIERSTFVLATILCLGAVMENWVSIEGNLWNVDAAVLRILLWTLQGIGWATVVASTFMIDHFELFGLRQVYSTWTGKEVPQPQFHTPLLYRSVRHPMMLGMLMGMWITPEMTLNRFVFASLMTVYVQIGIRLEERGLVAELGGAYRHYQATVPRLLPAFRLHHS